MGHMGHMDHGFFFHPYNYFSIGHYWMNTYNTMTHMTHRSMARTPARMTHRMTHSSPSHDACAARERSRGAARWVTMGHAKSA